MKLRGLGVLQSGIRVVVQTLDLNGLEINHKDVYAKGYDEPIEIFLCITMLHIVAQAS
jgi:hypothetical protein